jgi:Fibronectin type III domain
VSRSRRSKSIGAAIVLLVAAFVTQSGTLALADSTPVQSVGLASGPTGTTYSIAGGGSGLAGVVSPLTDPCTRYSNDISGAQWITAAPAGACASNAAVNQVTTYTTTFTLPAGYTTPGISGSFYADNVGVVAVNGHQIAAQSSGDLPANYQSPATTFSSSDPSIFNQGSNTLTFTVTDLGSVTGLDYAATATYTVPQADLAISAVSPTAPVTLYSNTDASKNTANFNFSVTNNGPSDATGVSVAASSSSPLSLGGNPANLGGITAGSSGNGSISATAPAGLTGGPISVNPITFTVSGSPTDPVSGNNSYTSPAITIDTVPDPVGTLIASPGNGSAVLSWTPPTHTGGLPLSANPYVLTVSGGPGSGVTQVPASAAQPCLGNVASVCYNVTGLTNGTTYTFDVQAQNAVGPSADTTQTAKPSNDAAATIVAPQTTQTVSTCKYATKAQPVCDNYTVPKGGGGVFALLGNVPLAPSFCGGTTCSGNGAQSLLPPVGYTDPKHPIVDTVTWDSSISPRGIFTKVYYQTDSGASFQLPWCKNPLVANPDPCLSTLIVLFNPFNPVVNFDVQARILLTSSGDPIKGHR